MQRRRWWWRTILGAVALTILGGGTSASAEPRALGQFTDRARDAIDPRGDIVAWQLRHGRTRVELRVRTREGADPLNAAAWSGTNTAITWLLDTAAGRAGAEYRATFKTDRIPPYSPYVVATVRDLRTGTVAAGCEGTTLEEETAGWWVWPDVYVLSTPRRCIGNPNRVRGWVTHTWDPRPRGGTQGTDRAPNGGPSPWVAVG